MKLLRIALLAGVLVLPVALQAETRTWDNDSTDGLWSTFANWSDDTKPEADDTVIISNGDTVDWNSTVSGQTLPGNLTINLSGSSTLTETNTIRLNGATLNVASGSSLTGKFWDLVGATINFEDGAGATMTNWEQKNDNTFKFVLGASGFTKLTPGTLQIAGHINNTSMSNATYIVDMASYTGGVAVIPLVDFTTDGSGTTAETFQWATLIVSNAGTYPEPAIRWNDNDDAIELAPYGGLLAWDGEAGDGLWTNAVNWNADVLPGAGETIAIGNGDTVEWDGNGSIPANLTVNLTGGSTLHSSWVLRFAGATINVASGCSLTSGVNNWFDLAGGTVSFEDGATNTVHNWEHKGNNTFNFELSETGFETLTPVHLASGGGVTWSNATYNIDISAYDRANGKTITLIDWTSHHANFTDTFDGVTANITGLDGGRLSWDAANHDLILHVVPLYGTIMIVR